MYNSKFWAHFVKYYHLAYSLFSLPQVVLLTCEQRLHSVEVELVFEPFPSTQDPDSYTVTCKPAGNRPVRTLEEVENHRPVYFDLLLYMVLL